VKAEIAPIIENERMFKLEKDLLDETINTIIERRKVIEIVLKELIE
jgi:hypothetical protein